MKDCKSRIEKKREEKNAGKKYWQNSIKQSAYIELI